MTALPPSGSFTMVDPTHVTAVGPAAAILFARITWRSQETGEWRANRRVLLQETGLTEPMLRTAIAVLKARDWVTSHRASSEDATQVWTPIHAGQADIADSAIPYGGFRNVEVADSAISPSVKTEVSTPISPEPDPELFDAPKTKAKRTRSVATPLPEDFRPTEAHWKLADSLGVNLREAGPRFVDYHQSKGSKMVDWNAALRTWIRNQAKFDAERSNVHPLRPGDGPIDRTDPLNAQVGW